MKIDYKNIVKWSIKRWWWFLISIALCASAGVYYFFHTAPKYKVEAVLMLRQVEQDNGNQDELLRLMGAGGNKVAGDEVKVLSSRDLMGRVVDSLQLTTQYSVKDRYWHEQYPDHDITVTLAEPPADKVQVRVKVSGDEYKIRVKQGFHWERFTVSNLDEPLHTFVGDVYVSVSKSIADGTYRAIIRPRNKAIEHELTNLEITRLSRESNVITLTAKTKCPARSVATINMLLNLYNISSASDKNKLAVQTEQFLKNRIEVVGEELNAIEVELEQYKRNQQIADLSKTAESYQSLGESYQQQVAEVDAEQRVLSFMAEQLSKPENAFAMIPGSIGVSDQTLSTLIQDYNNHIVHRNTLLQTATTENPVVVQATALLSQKRNSILEGIRQAQQTLTLRRQFVQNQQTQYDQRLASIPETERHYLEMQREKQTKEKQYLYLIEKQEENAMLLASGAVPAKVVDWAHQDPNPVSPTWPVVLLVSFFIGLMLPLSIYLFRSIRRKLK